MPPVDNARSNLLASIRQGKQLKSVCSSLPPSSLFLFLPTLLSLLFYYSFSDIHHMVRSYSCVQVIITEPEEDECEPMDGMAGALARALALRQTALQASGGCGLPHKIV